MKIPEFWIQGFMPVQFLLILIIVFGVLVLGNFLFKRMGKGIPSFGQAIVVWFVAYFVLKFLIYPLLPSSLLYTYFGLITVVIYLFISSTENGWEDFKRPILMTLQGHTRKNRIVRSAVFSFLPVLAFIATYQFVNSVYEEPVELRG